MINRASYTFVVFVRAHMRMERFLVIILVRCCCLSESEEDLLSVTKIRLLHFLSVCPRYFVFLVFSRHGGPCFVFPMEIKVLASRLSFFSPEHLGVWVSGYRSFSHRCSGVFCFAFRDVCCRVFESLSLCVFASLRICRRMPPALVPFLSFLVCGPIFEARLEAFS